MKRPIANHQSRSLSWWRNHKFGVVSSISSKGQLRDGPRHYSNWAQRPMKSVRVGFNKFRNRRQISQIKFIWSCMCQQTAKSRGRSLIITSSSQKVIQNKIFWRQTNLIRKRYQNFSAYTSSWQLVALWLVYYARNLKFGGLVGYGWLVPAYGR